MFHHVLAARRRVGRQMRPSWHRIAALVVGLPLVLIMAACTYTGSPGAQPTAPVKPTVTATPTPVPCATWRIIPSPNSTQYRHSLLRAVSALSPTAAWAVGGTFASDGGPAGPLIEQWNGTVWQIVPSQGQDFVNGVAAVSPTDVWAVGYHGDTSSPTYASKTVIQHWNGTQWSIVPSPNPSTSRNQLTSVVALAANDVWAVGSYASTGASDTLPLILHWDGAVWRAVSSPNPTGATASSFTAITRIPGTNQLWAVGSVRYGPRPTGGLGYFQPLIERWDGTAWNLVTTPTLASGSFAGSLNSVAALSATDAWAVGDYTAANHTIRTLIVHWNGTAWQVASSPDTWGSLAGVAAAGTHDVRAIGHVTLGDGNSQSPLIEQWDGTAWRVVTAPEPSGTSLTGLSGIAADSAGNFWVVGAFSSSAGNGQTLTLHCP